MITAGRLNCLFLLLFSRILLEADGSTVSTEDTGKNNTLTGHNKSDNSPSDQQSRRQVWSWSSPGHFENQDVVIQQLRDHPDLLDGIQVWCGCDFAPHGLTVNETLMTDCLPLMQAAHETNTKFQLMIGGSIPLSMKERRETNALLGEDTTIVSNEPNVTLFVRDAVALYHTLPIDGFSIDDERDCAPRGTTFEFEAWVHFQNAFAQGLQAAGDISLTSAVQALFGIQDDTPNNNPCQKLPSSYPLNQRVLEAVQTATLQKFAIMDTYYFSTGRFMGQLDWHINYIPHDLLAIGLMNRDDLTEDDWVARFHALDKSRSGSGNGGDNGENSVDWINVWYMPIDKALLPFLKRWKTRCAGCGTQSVLGCYDMTISCDDGGGQDEGHDEILEKRAS